ncbi:hypothetical protein FRX31_005920 [Thalictrum thalictroides]|uniref:Uncharacterized protein n=1 Tax=Thalictrum thalictroides TaxID=46969 RepID=A0A7J6X7G8_THATH|nr:hypothetical protein FRX31_005920 [Thalictrum thalictroides]
MPQYCAYKKFTGQDRNCYPKKEKSMELVEIFQAEERLEVVLRQHPTFRKDLLTLTIYKLSTCKKTNGTSTATAAGWNLT